MFIKKILIFMSNIYTGSNSEVKSNLYPCSNSESETNSDLYSGANSESESNSDLYLCSESYDYEKYKKKILEKTRKIGKEVRYLKKKSCNNRKI
jgi:hypothetical protein